MSRKTILNLDYALIQGTYWTFYVVAGIFVSVYMLGKGYSNTSIGIVIAVGNVMAVFLQGIIANITDKVEKINNITVIQGLLVLLMVLTVGVLVIDVKSVILTIVYTVLIVVHTALHPFVNALSFTLGESGEYVSFGIARSIGSFCAAVMGLAMGYLVTDFGVNMIPLSGVVTLIFMEAVLLLTRRHYKMICAAQRDAGELAHVRGFSEAAETADDVEEAAAVCEFQSISFSEFIRGNFRFVLLSTGVVALFFGNVILENFTIQIVEDIGGNTEQMGIVIFVMALLEMPAMLFFDKLKEKFSYVFLLRVSAIFFTIKIVMIYLADSMFLLYAAQINQVLGYGLMFPAMVGFIDSIMSKGEAVRGQAVFTTAITVGSVLGCVFGGRILDVFTVRILLLISSVITLIGTVIICAAVKKIKSV